jgi:hypothetical protein
MIGSVNNVSSKISGVTNASRIRRYSEKLSCKTFISRVEQFSIIADDDSEEDSMKELAANVTEATVGSCTPNELITLKITNEYLYNISILLQKDLDDFNAKLITLLKKTATTVITTDSTTTSSTLKTTILATGKCVDIFKFIIYVFNPDTSKKIL